MNRREKNIKDKFALGSNESNVDLTCKPPFLSLSFFPDWAVERRLAGADEASGWTRSSFGRRELDGGVAAAQ